MKKIFSLFLFILTIVGCADNSKKNTSASDSSEDDNGQAIISFSSYEHDFGTITEGDVLSYFFQFTNTGTGPLVINSANASCGCTVPKYDNKPIKPGESGLVEVRFNSSGTEGHQTKTITVMSNAEPEVVILKISADVIINYLND